MEHKVKRLSMTNVSQSFDFVFDRNLVSEMTEPSEFNQTKIKEFSKITRAKKHEIDTG